MATSEKKTKSKGNGNGQNGGWLRPLHRWLGVVLAVFILLLSLTGIALNHSGDWKLDRKYVAANWLLDAYGIRAPTESISFADGGSRVTLLGQRLYLNDREIAESVTAVSGMLALPGLWLIAGRDQILLFTRDGELVEKMHLAAMLPGTVERIGRAGDRAVISSSGQHFRSDADVSGFEPWPDADDSVIDWSTASVVPDDLLNSLKSQYRGRGLSVERLVTDIHNGRIVSIAGPYLMDAVAFLLIILSITGITMWMRPRKKK